MGADDGVAFGVLLRRYRYAARLTQEELAAKSGLSIRAVGDMERGRTGRPYGSSVARLAEALALPDSERTVLARAARAGWAAAGASTGCGGSVIGPASPAPFVVIPRQLPAAAWRFVGRVAELAELSACLGEPGSADSAKISVITGVAGVGKTGLALHWGHSVTGRFPDGQLYADLRGYDASQPPLRPYVVLDRLLRALGVPGEQVPAGLDERAALFRSLLHGRRVLIVLDNARSAEQVRPVLPGSGSCFVVISSRDRLDDLVAHDGARPVRLDMLTCREAGELLSNVAGDRRVDPATAKRITALCDRLPLALRIAAARLVMRPHDTAAELMRRLADERSRLQALSNTPGGVRVSFGLSYRELPVQAAVLFRLLGLLQTGDFAAWAAAALLGEPEERAEGLLDSLVRANLVETVGVDCAGQLRYRLHDLIRLYARERCQADDTCEARDGALSRLFGGALYLAGEADRCLGSPFNCPVGGAPRYKLDDAVVRVRAAPFEWFEAEQMLLTGAVAHACRLGKAGYGWELTSVIGQYFSTSRHLRAWRVCIDDALSAAKAAGDERGEAAMLLQHADLQFEVGRAREVIASLQRALSLLRRWNDADGQVACWTALAACYRELGQLAAARRAAIRATALLGTSTAPAASGQALIMQGLTLLDRDQIGAAAACFSRFSSIQQAAGNVRGRATARYYLAIVRLKQGRHAVAVRLLTLAMNSAKQSGDRQTSMAAQIRLGQALIEMGKLDQAYPLIHDAVRRVHADNSPRFRAIALEALGRLHSARGEMDKAAPPLAEAQMLRRALPANAPR